MLPNEDAIQAKLNGHSITTGEAMGDGYVSLVLTSDARRAANLEDHHSYMAVFFNGAVMMRENSFPVTSQTAIPSAGEVVSISAGGSVRRSSPPPRGADNEPMVGDFSGRKVHGRTRLTEVVHIAGMAYAVGTRRAVYRRKAPGEWECLDDGCYSAEDFSCGFNNIDGFDAHDIYAVGELGEIWHFNGAAWRRIESPTNCALNAVVCAADGKVYAAGASGTIVVGRGDRWDVLTDIPEGFEFWGIAHYEGALYLTANTRSVHKLQADGRLAVAHFGECPPPLSAHHLKVRDGAMWLFGGKDIRVLSGQVWHHVATLA